MYDSNLWCVQDLWQIFRHKHHINHKSMAGFVFSKSMANFDYGVIFQGKFWKL